VVIGRGGNVIRPIRQAYGACKIDIPDTKGPKRVVQIDSDDYNQLADCSTEIVNSMINVAQEAVPSVKKGDGLCELLINGPLHDTIENGLTYLSGLSQTASLNFQPDVLENSQDRVLQITGDMTSINNILKQIWLKFSQEPSPSGDHNTWFDPNPEGEYVKPKGNDLQQGRGGPPQPKEWRALVPAECTGKVIGAKGAKISELRDDYNCDVEMPDIQAPYKVLRIRPKNNSWDDLFNCIQHALKHVSLASENDLDLGRDQAGCKFLCHSSQAGAIIGTKGAKIEEIRKESGCQNLKVNSQNIPDSDDRIILAKGSPEVVFAAIKNIIQRLAEEEPRGQWNRIEDVAPKLSRDDRPGRGGKGGRGGRRDDFGGSGWDRPGMGGGPMPTCPPGMNFGGQNQNFGSPPMGFVQSNPNNGWNNSSNNWGAGNGQFGGPPQNNGWPQQQNQPPQQQQGGWGSNVTNQQQGGWQQSGGGWSSQGQQQSGW